jgi:hypothetical protein
MKNYVHLRYLVQFFLKWEIFQTNVLQKLKKHILCSTISFRKSCRLWDIVVKYCIAVVATDDNTTHAHCNLDSQDYKYTLKYVIIIYIPLQQRLNECVSMLRYTYIACVVIHTILFLLIFI